MNVWGASESYKLTRYGHFNNIGEIHVVSEKDGRIFTHRIVDRNITSSSREHNILLEEARETQASFKILEDGADRSTYIKQ